MFSSQFKQLLTQIQTGSDHSSASIHEFVHSMVHRYQHSVSTAAQEIAVVFDVVTDDRSAGIRELTNSLKLYLRGTHGVKLYL